MIDEPYGGSFYGGQIAAPVASRIFSQVFRYLRIEPSDAPLGVDTDELGAEVGEGDASIHGVQRDETPKPAESASEPETPQDDIAPESARVPNFYGKSIRDAARLANEAGITFAAEGSGFAVSQSIGAGEIVDKGTSVKVQFSP